MQDQFTLPWNSTEFDNRRFKLILAALFGVGLVIALVIPSIQLPEKDRKTLEKVPPSLAKVILKKKKQPPPPVKPKPKKEEKKAEPKPEKKPEPKPEKKPKPKPKKKAEKKPVPKPKKVEKPKVKVKQTVQQAQQVAKKSGLLALQDELADLRSTVDTKKLATVTDMRAKTIAASVKGVGAKQALRGSGGIRTDNLGTPAESVQLDSHQIANLQETSAEKDLANALAEKKRKGTERSEESIRLVMEKLKASFYTYYNRELRKDPLLEGKLVLEVVIEASGEVSYCRVVSSELNHPRLENKIVNRMKLANFGSKAVARATRIVPLDFRPPQG